MTEGLAKDSLEGTPVTDAVSGKEGDQMNDSVVSEKVSMVPVIELAEANVGSSSVKERIAVFDASISSALKSSGIPVAKNSTHCFLIHVPCHLDVNGVVQILNAPSTLTYLHSNHYSDGMQQHTMGFEFGIDTSAVTLLFVV